jgi:hypothetical protein
LKRWLRDTSLRDDRKHRHVGQRDWPPSSDSCFTTVLSTDGPVVRPSSSVPLDLMPATKSSKPQFQYPMETGA